MKTDSGFYLDLGLRGGVSSKNPLAERLGRWLRPKVGPALCAFGKHETTWYCQGWAGVEGALVRWICSRTHHFRHWGRYSDGPRGIPYPAPTWRQQEQWDATGRRMLAGQEAAMVAATTLDIPGECNDRWSTNRCLSPQVIGGRTGCL
jgi:hypothetical protein